MKNRIIKFRVWHKFNNTMSYNPYTDEYSTEGTPLNTAIESDFNNDNYSELMQFTGLTDKNGKEIFEGDYIVCLSRNAKVAHPVEWNSKLGAWVGNYGTTYLIAPETYEIEVVGNIYENSELLKTTKTTNLVYIQLHYLK